MVEVEVEVTVEAIRFILLGRYIYFVIFRLLPHNFVL